MLLPRLTALLFAATAAHAFKNTSPFLLFSSDPLRSDALLQSSQLALSNHVEGRLIETLSECDKKFYYIFTSEQVSASQLRAGAMPQVQNLLAQTDKSKVVEIPEIVPMGESGMAELNAENVRLGLERACTAKGKKSVDSWPDGADEYQITTFASSDLYVDSISRSQRFQNEDDDIFNLIMGAHSGKESFVVIYLTTPVSEEGEKVEDGHLYEMDDPYPSALHTDLKRDLRRQSDSGNNLPIFESYQFLTPGIFMGLSVGIVLFLILYTGISAIAGLEVSYFAFSKEMGTQAQKKQQ